MAYHITDNCLICGTCWEICPTDSIEEYDWYYRIADTCVECGAARRCAPTTRSSRWMTRKNQKIKISIIR